MMGGMVEHHVKYKELHGVDETEWLTLSEHKKRHIKLRKEGKCHITVVELHKIATAAYARTSKSKEYNRKYKQTDKSKNIQKKYQRCTMRSLTFHNTVMRNVWLEEHLRYNILTGNVIWWANFRTNGNKELFYIDI